MAFEFWPTMSLVTAHICAYRISVQFFSSLQYCQVQYFATINVIELNESIYPITKLCIL